MEPVVLLPKCTTAKNFLHEIRLAPDLAGAGQLHLDDALLPSRGNRDSSMVRTDQKPWQDLAECPQARGNPAPDNLVLSANGAFPRDLPQPLPGGQLI